MSAFSITSVAFSLGMVFLIGAAEAKRSCPTPVDSAVEKAYPDSKIARCKKETDAGKTQYEVKLKGKGFRGLEIDVAPEGSILQTKEKVKVRSVPQVVRSAFAAKYPTMKIARVQKRTKPDGSVSYEVIFMDKIKSHRITFSNEGAFIEEV